MTVAVDERLDEAPAGFLAFGDDGVVTAANATLLRLLGVERDELVGRSVESVFTVASRIFYQTHFFPLVRLHGRADEIFLTLRPKGGGDVGVLANAVRRERDGVPTVECVLMHVVERRKYEDALLQARRVAQEAEAALRARNAELERLNVLLESQALELELQHQKLLEQTTELETQQEELHAINDELTARTAELELQRAVADEANRAKSAFLAVMSHELRTPLNAIGGYASLLEMGIHGPVTEAQLEALGRVRRSQQHLLRLINEVLDLARIESGRVEYAIESAALAELVAQVMPMIEPQLGAKSLASEVRVAPDLVARLDREKVQQILLNLLTNAMKFTPPGGRVTVTACVDPGAADRLLLQVRDTGIGIPADMLDRVFEAFVRVEGGRPPRTEGTGLGLSISRDLARGMGGELTATSEVGVGSVFTLALPRGER